MSDALTYLKEVIALNSEVCDVDALALRKARRAGAKSSAPGTAIKATKSARLEIEQAIQEVAAELFEAPAKVLRSRLDGIDTGAYPDLSRRCQRLLAVVSARGQIDAAVAHSKTDANLLKCALKVLRQPQSEGAQLKRQFLARMSVKTRRKAARSTIGLWRKSFPKLYALESAWFGQLLKSKAILKSRRKPAAIGAFFFIYIVIKILLAWGRSG